MKSDPANDFMDYYMQENSTRKGASIIALKPMSRAI